MREGSARQVEPSALETTGMQVVVVLPTGIRNAVSVRHCVQAVAPGCKRHSIDRSLRRLCAGSGWDGKCSTLHGSSAGQILRHQGQDRYLEDYVMRFRRCQT